VVSPALAGFDLGARARRSFGVRAGRAGRPSHPARARPQREPPGAVRIRGEGRKCEDRGEWLTDVWAQDVGGWLLAGKERAVWWTEIGASWADRSEQENESGPSLEFRFGMKLNIKNRFRV
jgi:hypothetical protein